MKFNTFKTHSCVLLFFLIFVLLSPNIIHGKSYKIPLSNFKIISFRGEWQGEWLYVIGEIKNIGQIPGGPKIEVIARDSKQLLIASKQFWPNSTVNILPGNSCGIKHHMTQDRRAKSIEIKVINIRKWH